MKELAIKKLSESQRLGTLLSSLDEMTRKRFSGAINQVLDAVRKSMDV